MKAIKFIVFATCITISQVFAQQLVNQPELKDGHSAGGSLEKKFKKSPKKILINSFGINYQILFADWEGTRAGVYSGATSAELTVGFKGMEEADFQKMTDQLYADYISDLKSKGFEIITAEVLEGSKAVNKHVMKEGGQANYELNEGYVSTVPTGMKYYINPKNNWSAMAGKMGGIGALVVDININVPFIVDAESGASKLATSAVGGVSKIVVKPVVRISGGSKVSFVDPAYLAVTNAYLKNDLVIGGIFKDEKFKATAAAQTNTVHNIGIYSYVSSTNVNTSKMQFAEGDPEKYKKGVADGALAYLKLSNERLLSYMND